MPSRSPPLNPYVVGGVSHGFERSGLGDPLALGEPVGEYLVEDSVGHPRGRIGKIRHCAEISSWIGSGYSADARIT